MTGTKAQAPSSVQPTSASNRVVRIIRGTGWTAIGIGVFLLGFVVQQLFVTTYFAQQANQGLAAEAQTHFAEVEITEVPYVPVTPVVDPDPSTPPPDPDDPVPTLLVEGAPEAAQPFAIIRVPTIDRLKDGWTVVEGTSRANLRNGAGHMPFTPLPGQPGNAVISGHRTTYGAPFHELDTLEPGDLIEVETALGVHTYAVSETVIVSPRDLWVTDPRDGAWLTLTTCHPKFSSRQRLVVFASLVDGPNYEAIVGG
jgi:sortase A